MRRWLIAAVLTIGLAAAPVAGATTPLISGSVSNTTSLLGPVSVAVSGHYAYTTAYYAGKLTAIDFSNPASPVVAGDSAFSFGLLNASTVNIAGGYAYVVSKNRNGTNGSGSNDDGTGNSLTILDISTNPAVPRIVGQVTDATKLFGAYGVAVSGNYAYIAAQGCLSGQPCPNPTAGNSFEVVDVSDPSNPTIVASLTDPVAPAPFANALDHACSVAVSGHFAYLTAANSDQLTIIDISNPLSPVIVSSLRDTSRLKFPVDVAVQGEYAYVADQDMGLGRIAVVDVSDPANPQIKATVTDSATLDGAYRIRVRGNFAYVAAVYASTVSAIDISNPLSPSEAWHVTDPAHLNRTTGLDIDPTSQYVIASSPYLSSQSQPLYPPFPPATGAAPLTGSISVILVNPQAPANTTRPSISGTARAGDQLTAADGTWSGAPSPTFAHQWSRCDVNGANCVAISGATSSTYTARRSDAGSKLAVAVTGGNAAGSSLAGSLPTAVVDSPPASTARPSISGSASPGARLKASTGTWSGVPAPRFAYRWSRCDSGGGHCKAIQGATRATYEVRSSEKGARLEITVTATNRVGSASSTSAHTAVVGIAPVITGLRQSAKTWRGGSKLAQITPAAGAHASGKRPPVGTTFSFTLSVSASVKFAFSRESSGRKVKGTCRQITAQDRGLPPCEIQTSERSLVFPAQKGANQLSFDGRISRSHKLSPGPNSLTLTATAAGKASRTKTIEFTIVS